MFIFSYLFIFFPDFLAAAHGFPTSHSGSFAPLVESTLAELQRSYCTRLKPRHEKESKKSIEHLGAEIDRLSAVASTSAVSPAPDAVAQNSPVDSE